MTFLFKVLATETFDFLLLLFGGEGVSYGVYEVKRSLTPLGWAAILILPTALIFGVIYLTIKILKKPKLK